MQCEESIEKGTFRVAVEREVDTGTFVTRGAGYLHPAPASHDHVNLFGLLVRVRTLVSARRDLDPGHRQVSRPEIPRIHKDV